MIGPAKDSVISVMIQSTQKPVGQQWPLQARFPPGPSLLAGDSSFLSEQQIDASQSSIRSPTHEQVRGGGAAEMSQKAQTPVAGSDPIGRPRVRCHSDLS